MFTNTRVLHPIKSFSLYFKYYLAVFVIFLNSNSTNARYIHLEKGAIAIDMDTVEKLVRRCCRFKSSFFVLQYYF